MNRATDRRYGRRKSGAYGRPSQGNRQERANKVVRKFARLSLLDLLRENTRTVKPVKVIVIDTFRCGHARAYNTWMDANGQARCVACRRKKR